MGGWEEVRTVNGGGKVTKERITDTDRTKVTSKKEAKKSSNGGGGRGGRG